MKEDESMILTTQEKKETYEGKSRYDTLMDIISQWPEWKIHSLCLDESDLQMKTMIEQRRSNI